MSVGGKNVAVLWIRDGVLIDRMPINAAAFAFAAWRFSDPAKRKETSMLRLINFAFEKSGISCAEKLNLYQSEVEPALTDVVAATQYYNMLASNAGEHARFFDGVIELLRDLQTAGVCSFITSAVDQAVLDQWQLSDQGNLVAPYLNEVLGKRENFCKGPDHFEYIEREFHVRKMFYVADAIAEIQTGRAFADRFNISPIGFAHVITRESLLEALTIVRQLDGSEMGTPSEVQLDSLSKFVAVPGAQELDSALRNAGADHVVTGVPATLVADLKEYLFERIS